MAAKGKSDLLYRRILVKVSGEALMGHSSYGDPDNSLFDWLAAGDYDGTETPESIARDWDSDRE